MVNIEDFIKRLEFLLEYYALSASGFADKIGVQRSSLSHLLSGRNKPSLEFILKINEVFPEVDLYWILIGKGNFPVSNSELKISSEFPLLTPTPSPIQNTKEIKSDQNLSESEELNKIQQDSSINEFSSTANKWIDKIIFFYKDGTFSVHTQI